jgi:acetyl-CoA carboxylase carboxyl transferase subunit alpha
MLQNAIYSVISPEGCATILWRDPKKTLEAATAMKMSSSDLLKLNIIDEIIPEPVGGAHRDKDLILDNVRVSLKKNLDFFQTMDKDEILNHRKNKFLSIGRNKGFTTQSDDRTDLSMKASALENIYQNFKKNSKIYYGVSVAVLLILFLSILL